MELGGKFPILSLWNHIKKLTSYEASDLTFSEESNHLYYYTHRFIIKSLSLLQSI